IRDFHVTGVQTCALPISLRAMWLARPERDPRDTEGVVAIDEIDLHQDPTVQGMLLPTLRELLPNVQWIVTTQSGVVAGSAATHEIGRASGRAGVESARWR